ncbi:MAG: pantoate--beta-alanine ligase [Nitriliruptoraceae bacterium]
MERVTTIAEIRDRVAARRARGATIGFVPTMGALHGGHLSLVRLAAEHADQVVVSIFVNPTQFDRADDLAAYPRDLAADEGALAALGGATPDLVFAPSATQMYPRPPVTSVTVSGLTDHLCGARRPGHFDGVGLVVTKLLNIVAPDVAVFGRKDRQQLQIIRRLVADLDLPVTILAGPTVREGDGLALSSRNARLSPTERSRARALSQALRAAVLSARDARAGGRAVSAGELSSAAAAVLEGSGVTLDYLDVVDPESMRPTTGTVEGSGRLVVAVAAHVGHVRLIDNVEVGDEDDEDRLLTATD